MVKTINQPACSALSTRSPLFSLIIILLVVLLLVPLASANTVVVRAKPERNIVKVDEWASFYVTLYNNLSIHDIFHLSVEQEGVEWSMVTEPPEYGLTGIRIKSGEYETMRVFLKDLHLPRDAARPRTINLIAESAYLQRKGVAELQVYLLPVEAYEKNISVLPYFPASIHPKEQQMLQVDIVNQNARQYNQLEVTLDSVPVQKAKLGVDFQLGDMVVVDEDHIKLISTSSIVDLKPDETKAIKFGLGLQKTIEPLQTTLTLTIKDGNDTLYQQSFPLSIDAYSVPFSAEMASSETVFLKTTDTITVTNQQNIRETQQVVVPSGFWKRLFTETEPLSEVKKINGQYHHLFSVDLSPGEATTIIVVRNYRIVLYGIVLAGVIVFLYFMFRSPIDVLKHAEKIQLQEGGIVELRVVMTVKNRSHHRYDDVQVIEKIPALIKFDKDHAGDTLAPSKIVKTHHGEVVYWSFDLEAQEERIIPYHIKSRLSILGDFTIPASVLLFTLNGHKIRVKSNRLDISSSTKIE